MEIFLNVLLVVLMLVITVIPFLGNLWNLDRKKPKIYNNGFYFIGVVLLLIIFGVIQVFINDTNEDNRDLTNNKTLTNTYQIISRIDSNAIVLESKLVRIDSLNTKLDSLELKTVSTINKRNEILENFSLLNEKLERIYQQENDKLAENIPKIGIFNPIKWGIDNGTQKIFIEFSNIGGRFAQNFDIEVIYFETNKYNNIVRHKFLTDNYSSADVIPNNNQGRTLRYYIPLSSKTVLSLNKLPKGYIVVSYTYEDFINDKKYNDSSMYYWRGVKVDSIIWREAITMPMISKVENYIKVNAVESKIIN